MNKCILIYNTTRKLVFYSLLVFFSASILLTEAYSQTAPNAQFASLSPASGPPAGPLTGFGTFNCAGMPDFEYSISGDVAAGDTSVPGPMQVIDNGGAGFELIYGAADFADNIEVEVAGFFGPVGSPITNTVNTTLNFASPTPPGEFSFIIADVEQDQVIICALDENGAPVPVSVINTWFQASFDANNSDLATIPPTYDPTTGTLVGQEAPGGVQATVYQPDLPDNEAGAAWFTVTTPISQLTLKSQALGIAPDDPSQHFVFASTCAVYDLALIKEVTTPAPYMAGQDVAFDITVCNQGNIDAGSIVIQDDIPAGMTLSVADANGWAGPLAGPVTNNIAGPLAPGTCSVVPILLTIDPGFMGTSLVNNAQIIADDGNDVDSTPGDNSQPNDLPDDDDLFETDGGDDEDPEEIIIEQIYDLALIKTEVSVGPYMPGDDVTFDITVCNQGTLDAANIQIADNIPPGLSLSVADVSGWQGPLTGPVILNSSITSLPVGACQSVPLVMTIDPTFMGTSIINNAEIFVDDGNDVDSTPGDNSQPNDLPDDNDFTETDGGDDEDPEEIIIDPFVYDLALIKQESTGGPFFPGDDVTFTITIFNQGNVDAGFITIADMIPAGLTLSVNDANGWAGGPTGTVSNVILGPVAGGPPVTVDIVLTVDPNVTTGTLINNAEIATDNGDDVDSTPGDGSQPNDLPDDDDPTETDGGDDEDPEPIEVCNCNSTVDAGTVNFPGTAEGCIDDMGSTVALGATPSGNAVIPPGYVQTFVLTNGFGFDVFDCSPTPNFVVSDPGWFTIHPLVYDPNTFDPCSLIGTGTIFDIESLFLNDPCICGDVDLQGVEVGAYFCCIDNLQIDLDPIPPLLHDAAITLKSKGTVDMPSAATRFSAGTSVEMEEGFLVMPNSIFEAFIGPCSDIGN